MFSLLRPLIFLLAIGAALVSQGLADLQITTNSGSFLQDSGVQTLNVLAKSDAADELISLTVDIQLSDGDFAFVPGQYDVPGYIGAGNIDAFPSSDFQRDGTDFSLAYLSLDFNVAQLLPSTYGTLANLSFNVNGLAPGNYSINFLYPDAQAIGGPVNVQTFSGGFSIYAAVPEPSTGLTSVVLGLTALIKYRTPRRRVRRETEATGR
jgi:hypothetical protein